MGVLGEQLFVGVYTMIVYQVCTLFGLQFYPLLFITGFIKHLIGYYSGIQSFYCKINGAGKVVQNQIVLSSILEGFYFLLYGFLLAQLGITKSTVPLVLAFTIHLTSEILGLHGRFIRDNCKE